MKSVLFWLIQNSFIMVAYELFFKSSQNFVSKATILMDNHYKTVFLKSLNENLLWECLTEKRSTQCPLQERLTPSIYTQNLIQYPISGGYPIELSNSCGGEKLIMSRNPLGGILHTTHTKQLISTTLTVSCWNWPILKDIYTGENRYLALWLPVEKTLGDFHGIVW